MINVVKRNSTKEPLNLDKIHQILFFACDGLSNVSVSEIELKAQLQFYEGISTDTIHQILVKAASTLITEETPNYQYVAGRLINYHIRKTVYGKYEPCSFTEHVQNLVQKNIYDDIILKKYSLSELSELGKYIKHKRDDKFTYAAMEQLRSKYLVQDRVTKQLYESPQMMYMMISAMLFMDYPDETRISFVKRFYDAVSNFDISLPTPIMGGLRTKTKQFSSCTVLSVGDSLDSIATGNHAIMRYISKRAGIGINYGRVRAENSAIRNGEAKHTGLIPFLKSVEASVKSCSQGGIRGGAATVYYPLWHLDFDKLIVLKNNKGTEETRVRKLDHAFQVNRLMYQRLLENKEITLFSPSDVPGLYDAFVSDNDKFEELYTKYENDPSIRKIKKNATEMFSDLLRERQETGRVYIQNIDHCNTHSSFKAEIAPVEQSNLCCVTGDTKVTLVNNESTYQICIKDLISTTNHTVLSYDATTGSTFPDVITNAVLTKYTKVLYKVKTENSELECTEDHKIFTTRDYVRADELTENDKVLLSTGEWVNVSTEKVILETEVPVYDITVLQNHNFFANNILVHNCEITLPTKPLEHIDDENGVINLCTLAAINWGNFKNPEDMEEACELAVRALDALLTYQEYPIKAAERATLGYRPLGIGIINLAYFLAKRGLKYNKDALETIHEYTEAWAYYLTKASVQLAKEYGACPLLNHTKYSDGILPIDTYKKSVDKIVPNNLKMDWDSLRSDMKQYGIRNSTLMALMPSECQKFSNKVSTTQFGDKDFHELCDMYGINFKEVEEEGLERSFWLTDKLLVNTANGTQEASRLYYNGNKEVYDITFEDGSVYSFTANHQLKVLINGNEEWVRVDQLTSDVTVITNNGSTFIKRIISGGIHPTWDIEVPNGNEYLLPNGVVSHNTSSQISNSTSGIDAIRSLITYKNSKDGVIAQVAPESEKLKNKYDLLWDQTDNKGSIYISAVLQKFIDQAISFNTNYNIAHYNDNKIPMDLLIEDLVLYYKIGGKLMYYSNTEDGSGEVDIDKVLENDKKDLVLPKLPELPPDDDCEGCKI